MTSDSKEFVDRLVAGGGWLPEHPDHDAPDNPQAARIIAYTNQGGRIAYGITFLGDRNIYKYEDGSGYVRDPRIVWTREHGLDPRCAALRGQS